MSNDIAVASVLQGQATGDNHSQFQGRVDNSVSLSTAAAAIEMNTESDLAQQTQGQSHAVLQQQHHQQQLLIDTTQTQVEAALADLVSGVEAQTIPTDDQQIALMDQNTAAASSVPVTSISSSNIPPGSAPWAWHFAIAGVAASSEEGESVASSPTLSPNNLIGFVHTVEDAYDVMRSYEVHTTSKFVQVRTVQDFGKDLDCLKYQHRVRFEDRKKCNKDNGDSAATENRLPIKDTPFLLLGTKWFECQHGRDYHVNFKKKRNDAIDSGDIIVKRRNKATKTKKVGCLAKVWMKDVLVFPKKKLRADVKTARKMLSKEIRGGAVKGERRIYVFLPHPSDHKNHAVGEASGETQRVDPQVIDNIYWLVRQGIHSTSDVQLHLERYVKEELFRYQTPPTASNRRFFPTKKDIRNHIMAARKGRLPPKDRAEIAKQSGSLAATMCASNKLAFPRTNQTTRCRLLAKKIMSLSKKITNPSVMAEATKKMEDLVAFLRAGAQKEEKVMRMSKRAKEPSILKSTTLERPPPKKRKRVEKDAAETSTNQEGQNNCEEQTHIAQQCNVQSHPKETQQKLETNQGLNVVNVVEGNISQPVEQAARQQGDLGGSRGQPFHVTFQAPGLVQISLPLPSESPQIHVPLSNFDNSTQGNQSHNATSALLQRILQVGPDQQVSVIPQQSHYHHQSTEVDSRLSGYAANRVTGANDAGDSSAARALIQLDSFPIQIQAPPPSVIPNSNVVYTSSSTVQPTTSSTYK